MTFCMRDKSLNELDGFGFNTTGTIFASGPSGASQLRSGGITIGPRQDFPWLKNEITAFAGLTNVRTGPTTWHSSVDVDPSYFEVQIIGSTFSGAMASTGSANPTYTESPSNATINAVPFTTPWVTLTDIGRTSPVLEYIGITLLGIAAANTTVNILSGTLNIRHKETLTTISSPWQVRWN